MPRPSLPARLEGLPEVAPPRRRRPPASSCQARGRPDGVHRHSTPDSDGGQLVLPPTTDRTPSCRVRTVIRLHRWASHRTLVRLSPTPAVGPGLSSCDYPQTTAMC